MVGWVASLVATADSTTTELQNTLIRLFMPDCIVLCSVFCVVLIHTFRCNDDGCLIEHRARPYRQCTCTFSAGTARCVREREVVKS